MRKFTIIPAPSGLMDQNIKSIVCGGAFDIFVEEKAQEGYKFVGFSPTGGGGSTELLFEVVDDENTRPL